MVSTNARKPKVLLGSGKGSRRFVPLPSWIFSAQRLSPTTKIVYAALLDHTRKDRRNAWPSVKRIAEMAGTGATSVRKSLSQLEDLGMITIEVRPPLSNLYTIVELSDADIARIQGMNENALTCGDKKLRGSDLDPPESEGYPPDSEGYPSESGDEAEPRKQNQGSRTSKQTKKRRAQGAERPDQRAEMTQELTRTEDRDQDLDGFNARLQRIAAANEVSVTVTDALVEKLRGAKNTDQDLQFTTLDTFASGGNLQEPPEAPQTGPPVASLANNNERPAGFKLGFGWISGAGKPNTKRRLQLAPEAPEASESTEPTQVHQNGKIAPQGPTRPWERPLNCGPDGLDHDLLDSLTSFVGPALLEMEGA